jgi:hypothetical protein
MPPAQACNHCAAECLRGPDLQMMARCIALDIDCAEACQFAASVMGRAGENARTVCTMCAEMCRRCGEECAKHKEDHCRECAEACRRCAEECDKMAAMA